MSSQLESADEILSSILDRYETTPNGSKRIIERTPQRSLTFDAHRAFNDRLRDAQNCGAVVLEMGKRECSHLIERIILANPDALYEMLGRIPRSAVAKSAVAEIQAMLKKPPSPATEQLLAELQNDWSAGRSLGLQIQPDNTRQIAACFDVAVTLASGQTPQTDIRTFSIKVTGKSKFIKENLGRIIGLTRRLISIPEELNNEEALAYFGIMSFEQPCLISGSILYKNAPLPTEPYIGIAPEMAAFLSPSKEPAWILTVENLSSFNRQVREVRGSGIIIYTAGFPTPATLLSITTIANACSAPIYHWGDIDAGGVKIARRIETALERVGRKLKLHMMTPEIATETGCKANSIKVFKADMSNSVISRLAEFLASPQAYQLEQEELDPSEPDG